MPCPCRLRSEETHTRVAGLEVHGDQCRAELAPQLSVRPVGAAGLPATSPPPTTLHVPTLSMQPLVTAALHPMAEDLWMPGLHALES